MSLRHALLGLLTERSASGYDLLKRFETSLANEWPATQSQIYTELTRLADAGLITVAAEGPRGRKEYALTDEGLAELRHWLTETKPQRTTRSDVLLRVFFLGVLEPGQAHAYLTGLAGQSAELYDLAKQYAAVSAGAACVHLYLHGRDSLAPALRSPAVLLLCLERLLRRFHPLRRVTGPDDVDAVAAALTDTHSAGLLFAFRPYPVRW
jgi:DNA-binding PadR family transcriptional regulator